MIREIAELRRVGVTSRPVDGLTVPVASWRAAMCRAAHQDGARVRTFLVPAVPDGRCSQVVFAVRIDPPPTPAAEEHGLLRRWRLDELGMPLPRWRTVLHGIARRERARVRTFLAPPTGDDHAVGETTVYLLWAQADPPDPLLDTGPDTVDPTPGSVTGLFDRARRAAIARHPSSG